MRAWLAVAGQQFPTKDSQTALSSWGSDGLVQGSGGSHWIPGSSVRRASACKYWSEREDTPKKLLVKFML